MENNNSDPNKQQIPVETDYSAHQENPGPAPTVNEPDNKGAGHTMKWVIPIVVAILLIVWFIFFRNNTSA